MTDTLPLSGIRVIDLSIVWAGPYATILMGDLGAEVIRIESLQHPDINTRGNPTPPAGLLGTPRAFMYPDANPYPRPWERGASFAYSGRNKKSVTIDLERQSGKEIFLRLVEKSDVIIENGAAGTMEKLGLTYDVIKESNPGIIMCSMPGYGTNGPYKYFKGYGANVEGVGGHTYLRGYTDMDFSGTSPVFHADPAAGATATFSILAAVNHRRNTGKGQYINLSQAENVIVAIPQAFMDYSMNGTVRERLGNRQQGVIQGCYQCSGEDNWVVLTLSTDDQWKDFCLLIGMPELIAYPRYSSGIARWNNHDEIDGIISEWTKDLDHYDVFHKLQELGIPAGPVIKPQEVFDDPHVVARGFYEAHEHPMIGGPYMYPGPVFDLSETPMRIRKMHPVLGADNEYVYKEVMGYSDAEYDGFVEDQHIGDVYIGMELPEE